MISLKESFSRKKFCQLLLDYPKGVDNDHNAHDQMGEPCSQRRQRGARAKYAEHHASDSAGAPPLKQMDSGAPGSSRCQTATRRGAHDPEKPLRSLPGKEKFNVV
jgi:hypothetical protein